MPKINQEEYELLKGLDDEYKWIARDDDLSVYDDKPVKVHSVIPCWDLRTTKNEWQIINRSLFHFIQWEDEEPYNIAELIKEYEEHEFYDYVGWEYYESEETEVEKDIEWFKKELDDIENSTPALHRHDAVWMLDRVHELYNQLDEPEVLSYKWVSDNAVVGQYPNGMGYVVPAYKLQNL